MELQELRIFKAIVEEESFSKAAEKLFVTQSAVSQSLLKLEKRLGSRLIVRSVPLKLTEAGRRFLAHAKAVLHEEATLFEDLKALKQGNFSTLSLAVSNLVNTYYCPTLLEKFCEKMPLAKLKVEILPSREIIYAVESEKFELGFGPFQKQMLSFETIRFFKEKRFLVISKNHSELPKLGKNANEFLKNVSLLTSYLDQPEQRPSKEKIRDAFKNIWEINSSKLRLSLVAKGLGAAFVDDKILQEEEICKDFLILREFAFGEIERKMGIYFKKNKNLSQASQKFIEIADEFWKQ
ncbi:LysR family transcriptional regulator [bacterium]|nr:LysR family transcriptional regulator [bacterium]